MELNPSINSWDWLGPGIYFWEDNPKRALQYAEECALGTQKNLKRIISPFVLGAGIHLGTCLNLLEPQAMAIIQKAHNWLLALTVNSGEPMPKNDGPRRNLDCAVIKFAHQMVKEAGIVYDSVRSAFSEGKPVYPGSNFSTRGHIEVCVNNPLMIKGYFLPRPVDEFNPYLRKEFQPLLRA